MFNSRISRRTMLRGVATMLPLPLLEGVQARSANPNGSVPGRMITVFNPHGPANESWFPTEYGAGYKMSPTLQGLERHREELTVFSGLCHPRYPANAGHSIASRMLTGVVGDPKLETNYAAPIKSISMDQMAANTIGRDTRFPSLQISCQEGAGVPGRSVTMSFNANGVAMPSIQSPLDLFNRLFVPENARSAAAAKARHEDRASVLDTLLGQMKSLENDLGREDRQRMADYKDSVRQVEQQLQRDYAWSLRDKPSVVRDGLELQPKTRTDWIHVMNDIMVLALRTDSTRVISMMNGVEVDLYKWEECGANTQHHGLQHHNGKQASLAKLQKVDAHKINSLSRFCDKLAEVDVPGGNLLEHTMIWYGHGMNNGSGFKNGRGAHGTRDQAHLMLGGSKLGLKHGQHRKYTSGKTPLCSLWVSMLNGLGCRIDQFADGEGPLSGIS